MQLQAFDYDLPATAIAQRPLERRDDARLLVVGQAAGTYDDRTVAQLPSLLRDGDVVVLNETRVLPARLRLRKPTGGKVEVFLLEPTAPDGAADAMATWEALVRPSRRVAPGSALILDDGLDADAGADAAPVLIVDDDLGEGRRVVRPTGEQSIRSLAEAAGSVPLPPYIAEEIDDPDRYQTVYAQQASSVAAPTAGLHFTEAVLAECEATGAELHRVELAVGLGTFRPILVDDISEHDMHAERYRVPESTWTAVQNAKRVVAVGTTTVRALESAATSGTLQGSTDLFISPGYQWKVVDALMTNFHMPKSSLLVMLAAFMGDGWTDAYERALAGGYRFLSFGDAMFVERAAAERGI